MQLDANGKVTREARATDVSRTFESRPPEGDWSITLEDIDGSYLQAFAAEGRKYRLTSRKDEVQTDSRDELDAQAAGEVLQQYLSGDPAWRDAMDWKGAPLIHTAQPTPPGSAVAGFVGLGVAGLIIYGAITRGPAMVAQCFPQADVDPRLAVLVGSMGLFALLVGLASLVLAVRARSWPTAQAEVTSSEIEEGTSWITAGGSRSNSRVFIPRVEYRYAVGDRVYVSRQIRLGVALNSGAEQVVARYPVGARVLAYYDAGNPGRAFLQYSLEAPLIALTLAVLFLAVFARLVGLY